MKINPRQLVFPVLLFAFAWVVSTTLFAGASTLSLSFSEFERLLDDGAIVRVEVAGDRITGELREPRDGKSEFETYRLDTDLADALAAADVEYAARPEQSTFGRLLFAFLPIALLIGFWIFMMRRAFGSGGAGPGLMSVGKSRAKVYDEEDTGVRFEDVAGIDEVKDELTLFF